MCQITIDGSTVLYSGDRQAKQDPGDDITPSAMTDYFAMAFPF